MFSCKVLIAKCFPAETQDITLAKKLPAPPARFYWQSDETRATGLFFFGSCSQLCPETRFLFQFLGALYSTLLDDDIPLGDSLHSPRFPLH
jgi:hypothetical protein